MLSKSTTLLRPAHTSEAQTIASMSRVHIEYGLRWRWTPSRVRQSIADPDSIVLVASQSGEIRGFAVMRFGEVDAHLHLLAVDPKQRRTGIGNAMLSWLEKSCRTAGMQAIRVEVRAGNRGAFHFYRQLGFRQIGRIAGYYDHRETALILGNGLIAG